MKIKLNEANPGNYRYYECDEFDPHHGTYITHRESKKYGYRFTILSYNDTFYLTQSLLCNGVEEISVHKLRNVNDGKAMLEAMMQFIRNYRNPGNRDA